MIRHSSSGDRPIAYNGFRWNPVGEWTECEKWDSSATCGHGLHGQAPEAGGYYGGFGYANAELIETDGDRVVVDGNKIKVKRARRVAVNDLSDMPKVWNSALCFHRCMITHLPEDLLEVETMLEIGDCPDLQELPKRLRTGRIKLEDCQKLVLDASIKIEAQRLDLAYCNSAKVLDVENIDSVTIYNCHGLERIESPTRTELDNLRIGCAASLKEISANIFSLKEVIIDSCPNLDMGNIEELRVGPRLELYGCLNLKQLPKRIVGEGTQSIMFNQLTSLEGLPDVIDCPEALLSFGSGAQDPASLKKPSLVRAKRLVCAKELEPLFENAEADEVDFQ